VILRSIATWFLLVVLAILNGAGREFLLVPRLGGAAAHVASTLLLCGLIVAATWFAVPWIAPPTARAAVSVGAIWLVMTLAFEFLAGHYLFGKSWPILLADYDLFRGRIWILVPLVTLLAPLLTRRIRLQ